MLRELIERYGEDAIVTARPLMLESGETYRWELQIDGGAAPEAAVHSRKHSERSRVLLLVHGAEKVEIARWATKSGPFARHGPAAVERRLGDLH